jgi:peptidoglycan/LPS O-acetylase OafA/YrhL
VRFARILALLLALATLGISGYLFTKMPFAWIQFIPANLGVLMSLYFWRKSPKRKKARKKAALASVVVVPFIMASAVASLFLSPMKVWPVWLALAGLAVMVAIIAILRIERKQAHIWADYYSDVA